MSDFAEYIAAEKLALSLEPSSNKSFDAKDQFGRKYQIKSRRLTRNKNKLLGVIRSKDFNFLVAIIFNEDFSINQVFKIPKKTAFEFAKYRRHQNGYILNLTQKVVANKKTRDITKKFI